MPRLPEAFATLAPFVDLWSLKGQSVRAAARSQRTAQERQDFYDAAHGLLHPALDYLDSRPPAAFDDTDKALMRMMLSLAGVALAVETQKGAEPVHALSRRRLEIVDRGPF